VTPHTPLDFHAVHAVWRLRGDEQPALGTPILRARPRYATRRAFRPDPAALEAALAPVREAGPAFFERGDWLPRLRRAAAGLRGSYESPADADRAIVEDMVRSLELMQMRCDNPAARHLCYPWYAGDAHTDRLARAAGAQAVYKGSLARSAPSGPHTPPVLQRLPGDLLRRLPGAQRAPLARIAGQRWASSASSSRVRAADAARSGP
jgi:hypothetical protein